MYDFYRDEECNDASFSIAVKGSYSSTGNSIVIPTAREYTFNTTHLKVTVKNYNMLLYMNSYAGIKCGDSGKWKLGQTQDVTSTQGCLLLGISLPHVEFELMKTEYDNRQSLLYVGQRPSDFVPLSVLENRPTSFQAPLVRCGASNEIFDEISPVFEQYSAHSLSDSLDISVTGTSHRISATFVVISLSFLAFLL